MRDKTEKTGAKSDSWRERMTITVHEYAKIVGVGRNTAYDSVRAGEVATRLVELVEAVPSGHKVFVVEGEKDVDNLAKIGVIAIGQPIRNIPTRWQTGQLER